ncbi:MAG: Asp-tRNA(Asn)/Glu-tRNA(Gln) amidotransferase subunit GatB [Planctomycetes bacterium]|nr:Asp-tRNA(Asn)/Glu-tRNA(Gln) amidotransferase subunit GatB [Planctomycetota bacterium]MCB9905371.1 Asp-tRNA(Asn)/Glu-tRNA(Gln) amidotransferase subunit GatB [Planctomycetota bacterium]
MSATIERDGDVWVSSRTGTRWHVVCGLEVHAQLRTRTKLFCGCETSFGDPPNSRTCPVCTGQPGSLPVLNEEALALAVRAALAIGADVAPWSKFDRKNYFYCDIPKNYQISQFDRPYCTGGGIDLPSGRRIRLHRIHLEEDAGKAIHDRGTTTLVDLNRAGTPLIESVTEADVTSPEDAFDYLTALKEILIYVGASNADMEKGELRCDVNVSVHPAGEGWRTKVEVKNLNSFRNVAAALEHEILRQIQAYESGDESRYPVQETRLWDADKLVTRSMRSKEAADDYRYFTEPDLPPVTVSPSFLERQRGMLPELPAARRTRYVRELGLSAYDADVLVADRAVADFFEAAARISGRPKEAANWISNEVLRALGDAQTGASTIDDLPVKPHDLAELIELVAKGTIHTAAGRTVIREMLESGTAAAEVVERLGLEQVEDESQLEDWCRAALEGKDAIVADVKDGKEKALGALIGPVMQASGGKANPQKVREILKRLILES